jgi:hypothetical protein
VADIIINHRLWQLLRDSPANQMAAKASIRSSRLWRKQQRALEQIDRRHARQPAFTEQ